MPPQPIAPVGKVQVFANPQCTEYADGQSDTVWVRLNQDFGYGEEANWGIGADYPNRFNIYTPTSQYPTDPYTVQSWVFWVSDEFNEPFTSGQVIQCTLNDWDEGTTVTNPQVIFE